MEIAHLETYKVKSFLEKELKCGLEAEINSYIQLSKYRPETADDVITYNEVAMLSLVKSALLRGKKSDDVWAIQEYSVYGNDKYSKGRADAFFMFREKEFTCDILFEAKRLYRYNPRQKYDEFEWAEDMKKALKQGQEYFKAEQSYFSKPTYVVTIMFEPLFAKDENIYMQTKDVMIEDALGYFLPLIAPQNSEMKLAVYGHIKKVK